MHRDIEEITAEAERLVKAYISDCHWWQLRTRDTSSKLAGMLIEIRQIRDQQALFIKEDTGGTFPGV